MRVGSRGSPLARAQVAEIAQIVGNFEVVWVETTGDLDRTTSLKTMGKTDFFTKELDEMLLAKTIDAAIHSAKDLPDPLPMGLAIAAITEGTDPRDALVFRKGYSLDTLPVGAWVATSSKRREEAAAQLRKDFRFLDLRGTIEERLAMEGADAVVIAEAALIRLHLTHLPRCYLPGVTVEGQGKLAVVIREGDLKTKQFFACANASCI